jgi:hypothetical protein
VGQKIQKDFHYYNRCLTNELFSKYFTEALVKEVSDFYIDTKSKKSRKTC